MASWLVARPHSRRHGHRQRPGATSPQAHRQLLWPAPRPMARPRLLSTSRAIGADRAPRATPAQDSGRDHHPKPGAAHCTRIALEVLDRPARTAINAPASRTTVSRMALSTSLRSPCFRLLADRPMHFILKAQVLLAAPGTCCRPRSALSTATERLGALPASRPLAPARATGSTEMVTRSFIRNIIRLARRLPTER